MTIFDNENVSDFLCGPWRSETCTVMSTNQSYVYITANLLNAGRSCKIDTMNITISHGCLQIFPLTQENQLLILKVNT